MKLNLEYGEYILTHPANLELLRQQLESEREREQDYIFQITRGLDIRASDIMEQYVQVGWKLSDKCPQSRFWNLIDDITNPPSYAITWGWVEPELIPDFRVVRPPRYRFYTPSLLPLDRRSVILNTTC